MNRTSLGRLEKIDLRNVWASEAQGFTPWLAQEENLSLLADTVGLELELQATEQNVGPFRADIVCRDTITDNLVLIENQLERTDHSHLGQILTYAAGLNAVTIVWIAQRITDEHRAALDWLNEVTDSSINFFGLEIELWRIGDSPVAPKFNVVSQPNDWTKTLTKARQNAGDEMTPTKQIQLDYWQAFRDYLEQHKSTLKSQKPFPQYWTDFAIGRSYFHLSAWIDVRKKFIGVSLMITTREAKAHYRLLLQEKAVIETEIGHPVDWNERENRHTRSINLYNRSVDPGNREDWPRQHAWLKQQLETFHRVFSQRVRNLNADDYVPEDDDEISTGEVTS